MRTKSLFALCITCFVIAGSSLAQSAASPSVSRYILRPSDTLSLIYRYTPEYNAAVTIQPDGYADFPLLGDLHLAGLPLDQARALIMKQAGLRLNAPEISISLKDFEKPYYIVGGEVGNPGRYEFRGPITVLRALEIAGGIRTSGKETQVLLIRPVSDTMGQTHILNLKQAFNHGDISKDEAMQPGDIILVPKTRLAKIRPYVELVNPASYGLYVNPTQF